MGIFWILLFAIVIAASFFLAFMSMKGMKEVSSRDISYGLFLIRNKNAFNLNTIVKLHAWTSGLHATFSLERLFKGFQSAFVIFAPSGIVDFLPELQLLELENYLPGSANTYVWSINQKLKKIEVDETFLKEFTLTDDQQFFWQIVCFPQQKDEFQITIRAMVVEVDQPKRIEFAKAIDKHILKCTGLVKQRDETNADLYRSFANRSLTKKEVLNFEVTAKEVLALSSF